MPEMTPEQYGVYIAGMTLSQALAECRSLRSQLRDAEAERDAAYNQLESDRTAVAECLTKANREIDSRQAERDAALSREKTLRKALEKLWKHTPQIDSGYCAVCRCASRKFVDVQRADTIKPGPCEDERCLSHVVEAALGGGEEQADGDSLPALANPTSDSESTLRRLLWLRHGCGGLYGDDGEMQCNRCMIDFKRDSADQIEAQFARRGRAELEKALAENPHIFEVQTDQEKEDQSK